MWLKYYLFWVVKALYNSDFNTQISISLAIAIISVCEEKVLVVIIGWQKL